uniref:Bidirectional sugar transporter SWEET n=1 Tax=Oryza punctata TaxID=4537 RepID=A0A0E0JJU9_ORYPU
MNSLGLSVAAAAPGSPFHDICCYGAGIAGNIFALRIVRNGSTEQFSAMPYIYSLLNCLICLWYGLPFVSYGVVLVATVNSIGAVFQLAYTATFIAFADPKHRVKVSSLLVMVFGVFALIVYASLALFDHQTRQMFIGYLSVASLIFMFASPLSIINLVIRTKSVEYMPFYLSLSMFLMSISFFAYGVLLHDFFIYIPNGIGTVLGVIQLVLYGYFRKGSSEDRLPLLVTHT